MQFRISFAWSRVRPLSWMRALIAGLARPTRGTPMRPAQRAQAAAPAREAQRALQRTADERLASGRTAATIPIAIAHPAPHALHAGDGTPFDVEMLHVGRFVVRVGRKAGLSAHPPLMLFNGIGGNIELLAPLASALRGREVIAFDIPGVGHSPMPARPYRFKDIAALASGVLDHYGHDRCDALGVSWGGAAAQQFARTAAAQCRRLILCATATGAVMFPARPSVAFKMITPRRYISRSYAAKVSGHLYGGDFRRGPGLAAQLFRHVKWQSRMGYYLQLGAGLGWTSVHWLHRLSQPTLVMAGADDPLIPLLNAKLMHLLIPRSELRIFDCGHLFLLTRLDESVRAIEEFLNRIEPPDVSGTARHQEAKTP
jgi:poly(3-hydroxyalkanoate) depolymerase